MGHCVFMHQMDSVYADVPSEQYQFPSQYLERARQAIGDWIVYLEPVKIKGTRGYYALAQVSDIVPDPNISKMYLALIEPGTYLEFPQPVAYNDAEGPVERGLLNESGRLSGRAQAAVRPLSADDFKRIVDLGLTDEEPLLPRTGFASTPTGFEDTQTPFVFEAQRAVSAVTISRAARDRIFRKLVLRAYGERCSISGLKFINGGGRAEVNAAHIRPVEQRGPDSLYNGIALCGTAHWMFDRGLISLGDDFSILVSRHVNDVESIHTFINKSMKAFVPSRESDRPHPRFLEWHRRNCFKQ